MAAGNDDIPRFEHILELHGRKADFSQPGIVIFHENPFFLCAHNLYFCRFGQEQNLVADLISNLFQFGIGIPLAGYRCHDTVNIAEIIIDYGADDTFRKASLHLIHFTAQVVPDRVHVAVFLLDQNINHRKSGL